MKLIANIGNLRFNDNMPFFRLGFRPFFLVGSLFGIVSLLVWKQMISGGTGLDVYGGALWWHIHEMLFGFVVAVIVGFLLTAVKTWTGIRPLSSLALAALVILWLIPRIGFMFNPLLPIGLLVTLDVFFLPVSALVLALPIVKIKLWRNFLFVPLLLLMAFSNGMMHWAVLDQRANFQSIAATSMVLLVTFLICLMGGRVIPMFTANGTQTTKVNPIQALEIVSMVSLLILILVSYDWVEINPTVKMSLFIFAALVQAIRAFRWRIWVCFRAPLVWSLHLSYWCIPCGLLLFGVSEVFQVVTQSPR